MLVVMLRVKSSNSCLVPRFHRFYDLEAEHCLDLEAFP